MRSPKDRPDSGAFQPLRRGHDKWVSGDGSHRGNTPPPAYYDLFPAAAYYHDSGEVGLLIPEPVCERDIEPIPNSSVCLQCAVWYCAFVVAMWLLGRCLSYLKVRETKEK